MLAWLEYCTPRAPSRDFESIYPTCCPLVRFSHISKMLRATGHARMVMNRFASNGGSGSVRQARVQHETTQNDFLNKHNCCQASKTAFCSHCARPYGTLHTRVCERGDLSEFLAARTCASCWLDKHNYNCNYNCKTVHCTRGSKVGRSQRKPNGYALCRLYFLAGRSRYTGATQAPAPMLWSPFSCAREALGEALGGARFARERKRGP